MKTYKYNGKEYTLREYSELLNKKSGLKISLLEKRIRKGWSVNKIMLPNTVKRPICQYDTNGVFIKKYNSINEAIRELGYKVPTFALKEKKAVGNVYDPFKSRGHHVLNGWVYPYNNIVKGYIWKYAEKGFDKKIDVFKIRPYSYDTDRKYLRKRYETIIDFCYKPSGRYYNNDKIKIWK